MHKIWHTIGNCKMVSCSNRDSVFRMFNWYGLYFTQSNFCIP